MKRGIACVVALTEIAVAPIRGLAADRVKDGAPFGAALAAIDGAKMLKDIDVLASDDFEGRSPGTHGEAVCYEQSHLVFQIRLEPLNRLIVHAGRSPVRLYPFVRFPNPSFGNTPRLCFIQKTPPVAG